MSVEYILSERDYRFILMHYLKTKFRMVYWIGAVIGLTIFCLLALEAPNPAVALLGFFFTFLIFLTLWTVELEVILRYRTKKTVRGFGPEYFTTPKRLTLTEDGLEYRTVYETSQYTTRAVEKVARTNRFVTVTIRADLNIFIPIGVPGLPEFYNALLAKTGALQPLTK